MTIAQIIDHTILKPTTALKDVQTVCEEAITYRFAAVCIPPYYVADARKLLSDEGPALATVVGFPFGYSHFEAKTAETARALQDGADEIDLVINLAAFRNNDLAYLEEEIAAVSAAVAEGNGLLKVIIESGILEEEEIIRCCQLYSRFPVHFLKTSTGYAEKGASVEAVRLMRAHLPAHIGIKASGGIRTYAFAQELVQAGATRLGCSASVAIAKGASETGGGY
jgi:deoxyribose-phosphate aldolase